MKKENIINYLRKYQITSDNSYNFTFKNWMESLNGKDFIIDFEARKVTVLNEDNQIISTAVFAKSLDNNFSKNHLLKELVNNDISTRYYIMLNGYGNKNYLYRRDMVIL